MYDIFTFRFVRTFTTPLLTPTRKRQAVFRKFQDHSPLDNKSARKLKNPSHRFETPKAADITKARALATEGQAFEAEHKLWS